MLKSDGSDNDSQIEPQSQKYYSILPDLATGWRPKNLKIAAPIVITFQENLNHSVFTHYTGYMNKLVYVGPRHENSYKFHSLTQHGYKIKYGLKFDEVPSRLQRQLAEFTMKNNERKGPFQGMNPYLPNQLKFDSNFQSGNLDLVIKLSNNQYNLFLRPDTNTCGHMQWFYFKISNHTKYKQKTIKLNICNNRRQFTLFHRGMKPFIYSKYVQSQKGVTWIQGGNNVTYQKLGMRDCFNKDIIINQRTKGEFQPEDLQKYNCLSFQYTFQSEDDQVYFAYCPPFTYTDMRDHVQSIKNRSYSDITCSVAEEILCSSMSGLEIPALTITDQAYPEQDKKCVIAMARIHPGESNGSYVMKGFLQFLISQQAEEIRKKIVFKVIPMINPDGVVFGNYRTGLSGKDLNRKFKAKSKELFPEIIYLKEFMSKLKKQSQMRLIYFLDFHGHSVKKNVFTYGPEYDVWTSKYQKSKVLPRILAAKTEMFRLQSCLFRVARGKKTTARAYMLSMVPYCYTIESSVGLFRSFDKNNNHYFQPSKWSEMGQIIGDGLRQTILKIFQIQATKLKAKKKQIQSALGDKKQKQKNDPQENKENSPLNKIQTEFKRKNSISSIHRSVSNKSNRNAKKEVERSKAKISTTALNFQFPIVQVQERQQQSDGFSEGKSDCESDDNDFDKEKYQHLSGKIMKFIESFNHSIVGLKRNKIRIKKPRKKEQSLNKSKVGVINRKPSAQEIKFVPSLKFRLAKREFSEKKITFEEKEKDFMGVNLNLNVNVKANKMSLYRHEEKKIRGTIASDQK